jgi:putative hemolysin
MEARCAKVLLVITGVLLLAAVYGFFVLASHSIMRSRSRHFEEIDPAPAFGAQLARTILKRADHYILVAQVGTFLSVLVLTLVIIRVLRMADHWSLLELFSGRLVVDGFMAGAALIVLLVLGAVAYVQVLKAVVYANPEKTLCRISLPFLAVARILGPLVHLLNAVVRGVLGWVGIAMPSEREAAASSEEISEIVEESSEAGKIEQNEGEMLKGVIQFSDLVVREVMTPRKDVVSVATTASLADVIEIFTSQGFSRVLVIGSSLDDVKGILMAKDMLAWVGRQPTDFDLQSAMREPYSVPNTKRVGELLQEFRRAGIHFAVVQDEHGGVDGVVTIEDLIEEIVGDILDEYDSPEDELSVRSTHAGDLLVSGSALIDELNESHAFRLPAGDYDTIAGFVINLLGRIPTGGEVVEHNGLKMKIERVSQNRIVRLRVLKGARGLSQDGGR